MTVAPSIDPARMLVEQLAQASPDPLRVVGAAGGGCRRGGALPPAEVGAAVARVEAVEKIGHLSEHLSMDGKPEGADPAVGDPGCYAPWDNLVLYYGDQDHHDGNVGLGTLHGDVAAISRYCDVTVRVERAD